MTPDTDDHGRFPYCGDLKALERVLAGVCRPGEFFVSGALALPMPQVEVEGLGRLAFPLPESQVAALIGRAEVVRHGKREATIDLSATDCPTKLVWLLEHHYSLAGLGTSSAAAWNMPRTRRTCAPCCSWPSRQASRG